MKLKAFLTVLIGLVMIASPITATASTMIESFHGPFFTVEEN
jgi:hypothetical protein